MLPLTWLTWTTNTLKKKYIICYINFISTTIFCKFKKKCPPLVRAVRYWDHMSYLVKSTKSYKPSDIWDFINKHHA